MPLISRGYWLVDIERSGAIAAQGQIVDWHAFQPLSIGTEARIDAQHVTVPLTLAHILLGCFAASHVPRQAARVGGSGKGDHQDVARAGQKYLNICSLDCAYMREPRKAYRGPAPIGVQTPRRQFATTAGRRSSLRSILLRWPDLFRYSITLIHQLLKNLFGPRGRHLRFKCSGSGRCCAIGCGR